MAAQRMQAFGTGFDQYPPDTEYAASRPQVFTPGEIMPRRLFNPETDNPTDFAQMVPHRPQTYQGRNGRTYELAPIPIRPSYEQRMCFGVIFEP
jgi:hypothetical protein